MIGTQRRPTEHHGIGFEKWVPSVHEFRPHPLNERIYGTDEPSEDLLRSIAELGVLQPIIVDREKRILAGHRRWQACKLLCQTRSDREHIPAVTFDGTDLEAEQLIIEANRQREKTPEQKAREFTELKRIETELAKQRQATSTGGNKPQLTSNVTEAAKGEAAVKAAAAVGMSRNTAQKLEAVVDAADAGNEAARAALDAVNKGEASVSAAHDALPKPMDCPECGQHFESRGQYKKHKQAVHTASFWGGSSNPLLQPSAEPESTNPQARLKRLLALRAEIEPDVPADVQVLKTLSNVKDLLKQAADVLATVPAVESFEEYESLTDVWTGVGAVVKGTNKVASSTKHIAHHVARRNLANEMTNGLATKVHCYDASDSRFFVEYGRHRLLESFNTGSTDAREVAQAFKRLIARQGYVCVGGYQFEKVEEPVA